jgi:hypothetical protein
VHKPIAIGDDHSTPCQRSQGSGAPAVPQQRGLTGDCTRAEVRDWLAIDFDRQHAIQQQKQRRPGRTLLDQRAAHG